MSQVEEKYLSIGSIVMLSGGKKRIMITGFCIVEANKEDKMWDYSGCVYPEGMISSKEVLLFDHEQIEEVYYLGLIDEEEEEFKKKLKQKIQSMEEN